MVNGEESVQNSSELKIETVVSATSNCDGDEGSKNKSNDKVADGNEKPINGGEAVTAEQSPNEGSDKTDNICENTTQNSVDKDGSMEDDKQEDVKKDGGDVKDEAPGNAEDIGSDDDKYSREDAPRRVLVKNVDRKKTADDIEDYFFDNYPDAGLENIYTCLVFNARSNKKVFFGNVILTFETVEKAKDFLERKLLNESLLTYRRKLVRHSLEDVQRRREERAASVVSSSDTKAASPTKQASTPLSESKSRVVSCVNFPTTYDSHHEVERYMRECHENVIKVRRMGPKILVTFKDQRSADRFLELAYVKFKGCYIMRSYHHHQEDGGRQAEKRKLEVRRTPNRSQAKLDETGGEKRAVQFKLKGIFGESTGYRDIKTVLENEHGLDVRFISVIGGEARVRLLAGSDTAPEVVYRLARDQVTVNGEVLVPASLTKEEEAAPLRPKPGDTQRSKKKKMSDWSDY